jgi:hypothetical protein
MFNFLSKNKLNTVLIVLSVIIVSNYFMNSLSSSGLSNNIVEQKNCSQNISIVNQNDSVLIKDIYVIPDWDNIFCLGKVVNIEANPDGSKIVFIGSNPKLVSIIKIGIVISMIFILITKKTFLKILLWMVLSSYIFLYLIESPEDSFFQHLYEDRSYLLFFLLLINIFNKNLNLFLASWSYFLFIDYNFFGIYVLAIFLVNMRKYQIEKKHILILKLGAFIFLFSRYLYGFFESFIQSWARLSQVNYLVPVRFWDIQWFFSKLSCNSDNNLIYQYKYSNLYFECPTDYSYGPLSEIIKLNLDIWNYSLAYTLITFSAVYYIYFKLIDIYKKESLLITIFLFSPPMNFLLDRANLDLVIMIVVLILFTTNVKMSNFQIFILFLFSSVKLHPIGAVAGIWIYSFLHRSKRLFNVTSIGILSFVLLYIYTLLNFNSRTIPPAKREDLAYGFLIDASYLEDLTALSSSLFYAVIFGIFILSLYLRTKKQMSLEPILLENYEIHYYCFVVWFILTNFYENYAYRYPIFYFLFFLAFLEGDKYVKFSILGMVSLLPIPVTNEIIQILILVLHRLCHYYFLIHISSNLITKIIGNKNFDNLISNLKIVRNID